MANPVGPPFYRLKLLGSGKAPVEEIKRTAFDEGYETGYAQGVADAGPGAGAAGTLVYDSGPAGLTFGVDPVPDEKNLEFSGAGDGEFYAGRMVFSGDTSSFQITVIDGDERPVPFECDSGVDFCFAFDEGQTKQIRFKAVYTDGDPKDMTVQIYSVDGTLIDTISATVEINNPYLTSVASDPALVTSYFTEDLLVGTISTPGATVMSVDSGEARPFQLTENSVQIVANGIGAFLQNVRPVSGGYAKARTGPSNFVGEVLSYIVIAYIDSGTMSPYFDILGVWQNGGSSSPAIRADNTKIWLSKINDVTPILQVPHTGDGWYAICLSFEAWGVNGQGARLYVTKLEPGFSFADVGSDVSASVGTSGTGPFRLELFYAGDVGIGSSGVTAITLFSSYMTSSEFAVHVNKFAQMI